MAGVNQALGRPAEALAYQDRGLKLAEAHLRNILAFSSESTMYAYVETMTGLVPMMHNLAAASPNETSITLALTWDLRMKNITLDTLCRYHEAQRLVSPNDPLAQRIGRCRTLKQLLANAALTQPVGLSAEQVARQTAQWTREAETLETEINGALSKKLRASEVGSDAVDTAAVRRRLDPDAALVEFARFPIWDFKASRWRG